MGSSCRFIIAWCTLRRPWRHHCYWVVVQWGMKLCFTLVGQAWGGEGDRHRYVTVHTHGDFIVLLHWYTRPAAIPLNHIILTLSQPYPNNAEWQATVQQLSILKSLAWLGQGSKPRGAISNPRPSDSSISQNGRRTPYVFGHPDWFKCVTYGSFIVLIH